MCNYDLYQIPKLPIWVNSGNFNANQENCAPGYDQPFNLALIQKYDEFPALRNPTRRGQLLPDKPCIAAST